MSGELLAYLDGVFVGSFHQSRGGTIGLSYDENYRRTPSATPLSLALPLAVTRHSPRSVTAWLEGLLPDNQLVRERWGRQFGVSPNSAFALLRHVGRDAAGAVQLLPSDVDSHDAAHRRGDVEWLSDADVHVLLRELATHGADWNAGRRTGRWSLAGAQAKVALYRDRASGRWGIPLDSTPTTHILKPAINGLDDHHLNDALCLSAARNLGLPSARVEIIEDEDVQAVVTERYDRGPRPDGTIGRRHQEDLCQALSVHPSKKYQADGGPGVGDIATLFTRLAPEDRDASRSRFFDALAFNVLIGGTDAHAKNYSLLLAGGRAQLAPLYDLASSAPYRFDTPAASAMKIGEHWLMREIGPSDWAKVGRRLALEADQAVARVRALGEALPHGLEQAISELPRGLRARTHGVAQAILGRHQRPRA